MNEQSNEKTFVSINEASKDLGVNRTTMYYYIRQLSITTHKFPLDRKTYIAIVDLERIISAKQAAEGGRR